MKKWRHHVLSLTAPDRLTFMMEELGSSIGLVDILKVLEKEVLHHLGNSVGNRSCEQSFASKAL